MNNDRGQIASNHYLGKPGFDRLNCAQSVMSALKDKYSIDKKLFDSASNYGGGRAPEGNCGAYTAAQMILKEHQPEQLSNLKNDFEQAAGSLICKEIRQIKKLPCPSCVAQAANFLDRLPLNP